MGRRRNIIINGDEPSHKGVRVGASDKVRPRRLPPSYPGAARESARRGAHRHSNRHPDNNPKEARANASEDSRAVGPLFEVADVPQVAEGGGAAQRARAALMEWIGNHPQEFASIEAEAIRTVARAEAEGRAPVLSIGLLVEHARVRGIEAGPGERFAVSNSLRAPMARYMVELHPEWRSFFKFHRSKSDEAFNVGDEHVGDEHVGGY